MARKIKGIPPHFARYLVTERRQQKFPSPIKNMQTLSPDSSKREILKDATSKTQGKVQVSVL